MMNRRQFFCTATGAAAFARIPDMLAAAAVKYDLIVKGGRVIDPSRKLDAIRDVAISSIALKIFFIDWVDLIRLR